MGAPPSTIGMPGVYPQGADTIAEAARKYPLTVTEFISRRSGWRPGNCHEFLSHAACEAIGLPPKEVQILLICGGVIIGGLTPVYGFMAYQIFHETDAYFRL